MSSATTPDKAWVDGSAGPLRPQGQVCLQLKLEEIKRPELSVRPPIAISPQMAYFSATDECQAAFQNWENKKSIFGEEEKSYFYIKPVVQEFKFLPPK